MCGCTVGADLMKTPSALLRHGTLLAIFVHGLLAPATMNIAGTFVARALTAYGQRSHKIIVKLVAVALAANHFVSLHATIDARNRLNIALVLQVAPDKVTLVVGMHQRRGALQEERINESRPVCRTIGLRQLEAIV